MTERTRDGEIAAVALRTQLLPLTVSAVLDQRDLFLAVAGIDPDYPTQWRLDELRRQHRDLLATAPDVIEFFHVATFIVRVGGFPPALVADVLQASVAHMVSIGALEPNPDRDLIAAAWLDECGIQARPS